MEPSSADRLDLDAQLGVLPVGQRLLGIVGLEERAGQQALGGLGGVAGDAPVAGDERTRFIEQAQIDYQDFAVIGDAQGSIEDGFLVLRVDLRPPDQRES